MSEGKPLTHPLPCGLPPPCVLVASHLPQAEALRLILSAWEPAFTASGYVGARVSRRIQRLVCMSTSRRKAGTGTRQCRGANTRANASRLRMHRYFPQKLTPNVSSYGALFAGHHLKRIWYYS